MNAQPASRRRLLYILLLLGFFFFALVIAVWMAASIVYGASQTAEVSAPQFAPAFIAKPTYTPIPDPAPIETAAPPQSPSAETPPLLEMSIVDTSSLPSDAPAANPSYSGSKYILVDISEQHMYVYENGQLIYSFVASTGINNATRTGMFQVQSKYPNAYGSTWNIWMPDWLGIYYAGGLENGIHALPILPNGATLWAGFLGSPVSYGCVVLDTYDASVLYNWAEIGTPVEIRW
jgi:lipoprotein-anchoring transpeptidase ErfK/SrfK